MLRIKWHFTLSQELAGTLVQLFVSMGISKYFLKFVLATCCVIFEFLSSTNTIIFVAHSIASKEKKNGHRGLNVATINGMLCYVCSISIFDYCLPDF